MKDKYTLNLYRLKVEFSDGNQWDLPVSACTAENALMMIDPAADIVTVSLSLVKANHATGDYICRVMD